MLSTTFWSKGLPLEVEIYSPMAFNGLPAILKQLPKNIEVPQFVPYEVFRSPEYLPTFFPNDYILDKYYSFPMDCEYLKQFGEELAISRIISNIWTILDLSVKCICTNSLQVLTQIINFILNLDYMTKIRIAALLVVLPFTDIVAFIKDIIFLSERIRRILTSKFYSGWSIWNNLLAKHRETYDVIKLYNHYTHTPINSNDVLMGLCFFYCAKQLYRTIFNYLQKQNKLELNTPNLERTFDVFIIGHVLLYMFLHRSKLFSFFKSILTFLYNMEPEFYFGIEF
jgi:hypothetical protein